MALSLKTDLSLALDPARMFRAAIGSPPDPWQARLLRSQAQQIILNCSRQSGKSTSTSVLALHAARYMPDALVLLLAPALRQAQELFRKVKSAASSLGIPAAAIERETSLALELASGGRIEALPGKEQTVRGYSAVSLLVVDEAARVPDDLYRALRPMLAVSGGRLILLSSPFGKRGFFYEEWEHGGAVWERYRIPATDVPRISPDFLEEERRALGPWFEQEYGCQFLDTQFQVFDYESVVGALSDDVQPLFGDV
jgi:Helicase